MKNKLEDLRNILFATLEALSDPEKPMAIDRALAIADVGRVVVDSAKVEVAFLDVGRAGTGFIAGAVAAPAPPLRQIGGAKA